MNNLIIGNKRSYKSTRAAYKFMEDPENSMLIVNSSVHKDYLERTIMEQYELTDREKNLIKNRIQIASSTVGLGFSLNCIIFDEFFYFQEATAKIVWETLVPVVTSRTGNIFIYSSLLPKNHKNRERQDKFVEMFENFENWKVTRLINGIKEEDVKISPWLFGFDEFVIPNEKILLKTHPQNKNKLW